MAVDDGAGPSLPGDQDAEIEVIGASVPERRRSLGVYALAVLNLLLAVLSFCAERIVTGAELYTLKESADIGADLEATLLGLWIIRVALYVAAGGFILAALATISHTRLGWKAQVLWAGLLCLTLVGLPYGLPALVFMLRQSTRAGFLGPRRT